MLLPHTVCITIVLSRHTIRPPDCFIEMKVHVCELCSGCLHVRVAGCRGVILDKVKSRRVTLVRRTGSTMFTVTRARNHPPTFSSKSTAPNCIMLSFPFFFFSLGVYFSLRRYVNSSPPCFFFFTEVLSTYNNACI